MNEQAAVEKYNQRYDEALFVEATYARSIEFTFLLVEDALALCGHPNYRWEETYWTCYASDAQLFLKKMLDN